jgi:chorismate mutase
MKRYEAALGIQDGIQSLGMIARALAAATEEAIGEGIGAERDAAVRIMVYQLARLCRVDEISYGYDPVTLADTFRTLMDECKARAQESHNTEMPLPLLERHPDALPGTRQRAADRPTH